MMVTTKRANRARLNALVRTIATHYGCSIEYDDVLEKWIVQHSEVKCGFYWSSTETLSDFLDGLKEHFAEIGAEPSRF